MATAKHEQSIFSGEDVSLVAKNPKSQSSQAEHKHQFKVKHGQERLDRRSGMVHKGQPKKSGHGGKFTWDGPLDEVGTQLDDPSAALDEKDPNYVDEQEIASIPEEDNVPHELVEEKARVES